MDIHTNALWKTQEFEDTHKKNQQWNGQSVSREMRKMGNTDFKFRMSAIKNNGVFAGSSNQNWEK